MPQSSLHPNNQATKCCSWWFGCFGFLFNTTLKFYNTRFEQNLGTIVKQNQTSSTHWKKRQQPSHHHGSTPALHWQRQWQHSCRAYPTWSVPFPAGKPGIWLQDFRPGSLKLSSFAHQLRHDGIWGVLIQCLVEFTGWSWHYLSTKSITSRSSCPLNEVWLSPHYFTHEMGDSWIPSHRSYDDVTSEFTQISCHICKNGQLWLKTRIEEQQIWSRFGHLIFNHIP